jgi:hypothetical protein
MGPLYYHSTRGQVTRCNTNEHNLTNPPNLLPMLLLSRCLLGQDENKLLQLTSDHKEDSLRMLVTPLLRHASLIVTTSHSEMHRMTALTLQGTVVTCHYVGK